MELAPEVAATPEAPAAPERYVGPRPFEPQDREVFFGRDGETLDLVALVVAYRVVLLYAASGAGKTSLLNAGLVPALEQEEGFEVLPPARIRPLLTGETLPETVANAFTFGVLCNWSRDLGRDEAEQALAGETIAGFLAGLPHPVDEHGLPRARAVVFDQFEELFTVNLDRWRDREEFVAQIAAALEADPLLRVVIAVREDYLAQLDPFADLLPGGFRGSCRLERLDREAALEAVDGPIRDTPRSYAPGVAERLVDDLLTVQVEANDGSTVAITGEYVEPVQLQVACRSLWERLPPDANQITAEHLEHFGNVDEVLAAFYVEAVRAAAARARVRESSLRRNVERALLTPGGTRGTAYRDRKTTGGIPNAAVDELEARHLVRAERRAGARWYELTHDRLIGPLKASNAAFSRALLRRRIRFAAWTGIPLALVLAGVVLAALLTAGGSGSGAAAVSTVIEQQQRVAQEQARLTGLVTKIFAGTRALNGAVFSPDGRLIAAASDGGDILEWRVSTGQPVRTSGVSSVVTPPAEVVAFNSAGSILGAGDAGGHVQEWHDHGRGQRLVESVSQEPVRALAYPPEGDGAAVGSDDGAVTLFPGHHQLQTGAPVRSVEFQPGGTNLLMAAGGNAAQLWSQQTGRVVATFRPGQIPWYRTGAHVAAAAFSPNGALLATSTVDRGDTVVWDVRTRRPLGILPGASGGSSAVAFSPDGSRIAVAAGASVRVWYWPDVKALNLGNPVGISRFQRRHGIVADGIVGPETGQAIVTALQPAVLAGQRGDVTSVVFSPDGDDVLTASRDGTAWTWGEFAAARDLRQRIVQAALAGVENSLSIGFLYAPTLQKVRLPSVPTSLNAVSFITWAYWQAGAPDPNGNDYEGGGLTGSLLAHSPHIPRSAVKPGDVVVFGSGPGRHAALVVRTGRDPLLASHGSSVGPELVRFSVEAARLHRVGADQVTWLDPLA